VLPGGAAGAELAAGEEASLASGHPLVNRRWKWAGPSNIRRKGDPEFQYYRRVPPAAGRTPAAELAGVGLAVADMKPVLAELST
jgi:hypothetical protein